MNEYLLSTPPYLPDWISGSRIFPYPAEQRQQPSRSSGVYDGFTGPGCIFTEWTVFQPPGHWTSVCWRVAGPEQHSRRAGGSAWDGSDWVDPGQWVVERRVGCGCGLVPGWHGGVERVCDG